ncbi:TetR/AcrR family transcriptional regulator [Actinoallomurus iriomotensis]|uniref:TetR family transcriptional regulator n=1 Tax=Actinoallomurus iriomotensis TaxID=478107 RepID=A0A9W6S652_9ACTN|nr:TetR/AcrR family transcriptional regulator [Actinoallomurus iriomotensis]GLY87779.1 TetR family transcriptional regulator [Actinoallomurus iriomotensis]
MPDESRPLRADARRNRARILAVAEAVFAEKGPSASTEEVAERAGVAIGTVFRHFPTKRELLQAIMKDVLSRLTGQATALAADGDPGTALFTFFADLVAQAAEKKTVVELLSVTGAGLTMTDAVRPLRRQVAALLDRAKEAGAVRTDVRIDEVMALLAATCQGALQGGWDADLRERALAIVFTGLRARAPG